MICPISYYVWVFPGSSCLYQCWHIGLNIIWRSWRAEFLHIIFFVFHFQNYKFAGISSKFWTVSSLCQWVHIIECRWCLVTHSIMTHFVWTFLWYLMILIPGRSQDEELIIRFASWLVNSPVQYIFYTIYFILCFVTLYEWTQASIAVGEVSGARSGWPKEEKEPLK